MVSIICLVLLPLAVAWGTWLTVESSLTAPLRYAILRRHGQFSNQTIMSKSPQWHSLGWSIVLCVPTCLMLPLPLWVAPLFILAMSQAAPMILSMAEKLNREVGSGISQ